MRTRSIVVVAFLLSVTVTVTAGAQSLPAPASAELVRLADLIAEAERSHPAIQAGARMVESKRARISQARAWPDLRLSISYMGDPAPFKTQANDPASYRQIGVMQEIPYPGKRELRGKIAERDVDAEQWSYEATRRRVLTEVRLAYFDVAAVDKALEITTQNKDLLGKLARIAEEKYKVGKGLQQDVLRSQIEVTKIEQRLTLLGQRRRTLEAQLNSLLLRAPETPVGQLAPVEKSALTYSLEELLDRGVQNAPEIRRQEQFIEQSLYAVNLAQKSYYPDFSVGWDYQNRGSGLPGMYGVSLTVNLPIFYKSKQRQAVSEASLAMVSARHMREAIRTALLFQVKEQYLAARTSDELLNLYTQAIVPQSTLTLESSLAAYQVGAVDFLNVLTNFITVLDYEISYHEELSNYQKALARLQEITGTELVK